MKYSTAAFTFALALLAANNDVADAGEFNLRGRGAIKRRRARHLKNQDTTGDDALAADNRATPKVAADDIITEDTAIVEEESIKSEKEPKGDKEPKGAMKKMEEEVETIVTEIENMAETAVEEIMGKKEKASSQSSDEEEVEELAAVDAVEGEGKVRTFYFAHRMYRALYSYT